MKKYFAFDLETTGVDVEKDEPVEIAFAIVPEEGPYRVTSFTVSSKVHCSPEASLVHGITQAEIDGGLDCSIVCDVIANILSKNAIDGFIGFNCFRFDIPMLASFFKKHFLKPHIFGGRPVEDPALWYLAEKVYKKPIPSTYEEMREIADTKVPYGTRYNLKMLCDIYGVQNGEAHRAEGDLRATIDLWRKMKSIRRVNESRSNNG